MSDEFWLVAQAVLHFTKRLAHAARPHPVSAFHGARMFQLLFAAGWEPTRTHFADISDDAWGRYQHQALLLKAPVVTFDLLPLQTRLPDKTSIPKEPEDSTVPVRFYIGSSTYMVPLTCSVETRRNSRYYLNILWEYEHEDGPYMDHKGLGPSDEMNGEDLQDALLARVGEIDMDFDRELREYIFHLVSDLAFRQASAPFYRAWWPYLADQETADCLEERLQCRASEILERIRVFGENRLSGIAQTEYMQMLRTEKGIWEDEAAQDRLLDRLGRLVDDLVLQAQQGPLPNEAYVQV